MSTQPTLQDLRKAKFKTIKDFSIAYGCSASKASMILQGRYQSTLSKDEVVQLAALFEVPFETCVAACNASYAEWKVKNNQRKSSMDMLENLWKMEERIRKEAEQAKQSGDWSSYQDTNGNHWRTSWSAQDGNSGSTRFYEPNTSPQSCYAMLGVSQNATEAQIRKAFRDKVKASHDGKGGYTVDMDKLTQAKEQALAGLKARA
jgi:hypothetical protein